MSHSAARTLDVLSHVLSTDKPPTVMEVTTALGVDKSTASRILHLLVERGLLTRNPAERHEPGPAAYSLLAMVGRRLNLRTVAAPYILDLRDLTGETLSLHLLVGDRRVCVDGAESLHAVRRVVPWGESLPLWSGPSGKVMLAHLASAPARRVMRLAEMSGIDVSALRDKLTDISRQHYCHTVGDRTAGVRAVSVPLVGMNGIAGALTVAGPADRFSAAEATECTERLLEAGKLISAAMGGTWA
ncbi:MAG TPA: IclR family transcriptional regulator [Streptosporangiaceae bacterium]|nr:IclR family transcriptional regulator [Streptosporangiaceae bacterium]